MDFHNSPNRQNKFYTKFSSYMVCSFKNYVFGLLISILMCPSNIVCVANLFVCPSNMCRHLPVVTLYNCMLGYSLPIANTFSCTDTETIQKNMWILKCTTYLYVLNNIDMFPYVNILGDISRLSQGCDKNTYKKQ